MVLQRVTKRKLRVPSNERSLLLPLPGITLVGASRAPIYRATICLRRGIATQELTTADYQALAEFRHQIRRFLHFSEQAARRAGLEPSQHQLLLAVKGHPAEPTVGELAERLQLRHHSVVGLLDRLAQRALVRRSRGVGDRRQVRVRLTPKGEAVLRRLSLEHRAELESGGHALLVALQAIAARPRTQSPGRNNELSKTEETH